MTVLSTPQLYLPHRLHSLLAALWGGNNVKATANLGMCSRSCFLSCLCSLAREAGCLCPHLPGLLCRPVFQSSTWQALKALSLLPSAMPMKTLASAWRKVLISSFSEKAGAACGQNSARSYLGIPSVPVSPKYNHKLWCHSPAPLACISQP